MTAIVRRQTLADLLRRSAARDAGQDRDHLRRRALDYAEFDEIVSLLAAGHSGQGAPARATFFHRPPQDRRRT
jgi:fatty-acyl-CoA synthase